MADFGFDARGYPRLKGLYPVGSCHVPPDIPVPTRLRRSLTKRNFRVTRASFFPACRSGKATGFSTRPARLQYPLCPGLLSHGAGTAPGYEIAVPRQSSLIKLSSMLWSVSISATAPMNAPATLPIAKPANGLRIKSPARTLTKPPMLPNFFHAFAD